MKLPYNIINFVTFQLAWFVTIFSAANGLYYFGILLTVIWMLMHVKFVASKKLAELKLLLVTILIAYPLESILVASNMVSYPEQANVGFIIPIWMICLWLNLAATINYSLSWLKGRLLVTCLLAAIAGPAAYYAGENIGAISLNGTLSLFAISLMWAVAMPCLFLISAVLHEHKSINHSVAKELTE
jgi:hypothetical protein